MRVGIVRFPGSNCDSDCLWAFGDVLGTEAEYVWHKEERFRRDYDLVVLPGGFAYGDYLRAGAIARCSPVLGAVERHAQAGGLVLGICNGFQVLTESGLLPGALMMNRGLKFLSRDVHVRVEAAAAPWTGRLRAGQVLKMPIAHQEGAYVASAAVLDELGKNGQILLTYTTPGGALSDEANPNGSERAIAGIRNREGNVFGLMPHPERAMDDPLSRASDDGLTLHENVAKGTFDGRVLLSCLLGEGVRA